MKRIFLLVLLVLSSCTILPQHHSILDDSSCNPPCWNGIVVGKTSRQQLLDIISTLPFVDQNNVAVTGSWNIFDDGVRYGLYPVKFPGNKPLVYVETNFIEDKMVFETFSGDLGVTFDEAVQKIGGPKNVIIQANPFGGYWVTAIDSAAGIGFGYATRELPKDMQSEIRPDIELGWIDFFDPTYYEQFLEAKLFSMGEGDAQTVLELMHPWVGYGEIEEKYLSQ